MIRAAMLALLLPAPAALADGLDCTFTTICSPLTECLDHDGVPFRFDAIDGTLAIVSDAGPSFGTLLSNVTPPALAAIFDAAPDTTILLSVSGSGEAVMTEQQIATGDHVRSISYFGTCEPGA